MKIVKLSHNPLMKSLFAIPLTLLLVLIPIQLYATQDIQGKVMKVKDGDTVVIAPVDKEQFVTCRLHGIDAPETAKRRETGQLYGEEATKELKRMILAKDVQVVTTNKDHHNWDICFITLDGLDVNLEMVKKGFAWAVRKDLRPPYLKKYVDAESDAKKGRLGLWHDRNPESPWDYRNRMKERSNVFFFMDTLPKTVNEAVAILLSEMSGSDKLRIRNTKKEDLVRFHLTWGYEIRNQFGLWSGNDALIKDASVTHPDSASTVIMEAVWEELQRQLKQ